MRPSVELEAERLALFFSEEKDIPFRYKKKQVKGAERDSGIETQFKSRIQRWKDLIEVMLSKIDGETAWRFIKLQPKVENTEQNVFESLDFLAFTSYFTLRRDVENCTYDEIGKLAMLRTALQKRIAFAIKNKPKANL